MGKRIVSTCVDGTLPANEHLLFRQKLSVEESISYKERKPDSSLDRGFCERSQSSAEIEGITFIPAPLSRRVQSYSCREHLMIFRSSSGAYNLIR